MAEFDRFDSELTAAVQAYADRALTEVDAVAVATHAARGRRPASVTWLGRTVTVPVVLLLILVLSALLSVSFAVGGWWPFRASLVLASPVATIGPAAPTAPGPSLDPLRRAHVTGTETVVVQTGYDTTVVGDVTQLRGGVLSIATEANDPRVSGTATFAFSIDVAGDVGAEWGTYHLDAAGGAWDGACSGSTWGAGTAAIGTCWLTGSGSFAGLTYSRSYSWIPGHVWIEGVIYPGPAPQP